MIEQKQSLDNWLDYLIKRWPLFILVGVLVVGVSKTQWVQSAQADEIREIKTAIEGLKDIHAEWPYLKKQVDKMDDKLDRIGERLGVKAV